MIHREHILQSHARKFCIDAINAEFEFISNDRAKIPGRSVGARMGAAARQRARGITPGTADTVLIVGYMRAIWIEWKAPGAKVKEDDDQWKFGQRMMHLGCWWSWFNDIPTFALWLESIGVPMRANAGFLAQHHQGIVDSVIAKAETKKGKAPKSYKPGPRHTMTRAGAKRVLKAGIFT